MSLKNYSDTIGKYHIIGTWKQGMISHMLLCNATSHVSLWKNCSHLLQYWSSCTTQFIPFLSFSIYLSLLEVCNLWDIIFLHAVSNLKSFQETRKSAALYRPTEPQWQVNQPFSTLSTDDTSYTSDTNWSMFDTVCVCVCFRTFP